MCSKGLLVSSGQAEMSGGRAWPLIHPFFPFFESPLECIVDDGIGLLGICFEEVKIKYVDGILAFVFSFAS